MSIAEIPPLRSSALKGIAEGSARVAEEAQNLASSFLPAADHDAVSAVVGMKQGEQQVKSAAKLTRVADELDRAVLDIIA